MRAFLDNRNGESKLAVITVQKMRLPQPYLRYSHEASEILRDVPRHDLLAIASKRKGYG